MFYFEWMSEFLTVKEVAVLLKVNPITVLRWIKRKTLPALRFGREFRIKKEDIEKYGRVDKNKTI